MDISVLKITGDAIVTLATDGDVHLGGTNFNNRMLERCKAVIELEGREMDWKSARGKKAELRLYLACKLVKHSLIDSTSAMIEVDSLFGEDGDFEYEMTRGEFE